MLQTDPGHRTRRAQTVRAPATTRWLRTPALALAPVALLLGLAAFPRVRESATLLPCFLAVAALLSVWCSLAWALGRSAGFALELRRPLPAHFVQMGVQLTIYAYWGSYWPQVLAQAPLVLAQIAFLIAVEGLLSWSRRRPWRLGLGAVPVVLSTNLFIWFRDDWFALQFLMVATCALGKEFLRWNRGGRSAHVFNPSAFGLGVFALGLIATGKTAEVTWGVEIAASFAQPTHFYLLIFGLGLVIQYLFAVTLMTLSAAATLVLLNLAYTGATGAYQFVDTNIPVAIFLGLHLLITDPATSPRSSGGRVLFGALYGVGSFAMYGLLRELGAPEFYDKLLTVPLMNLSVQALDRLTRAGPLARLERWQAGFRPRSANLVHMGCWAALFAALLGSGFVQGRHPGASIAFWRQAAAEGRPRAEQNLVRLLRARGERGAPGALDQLGTLYREGQLVEPDQALATDYFARAFRAGSARGAEHLVEQFLDVEGARPGELVQRALDGLERVCERDASGHSAFLVARAYERGGGRPADPPRALELYLLASRRGALEASKAAVRLARRLPGQPDLRAAAATLARAGREGDAESCLLLAELLQDGRGLERDPRRARALRERAAELGAGPARHATGASRPAAVAPVAARS